MTFKALSSESDHTLKNLAGFSSIIRPSSSDALICSRNLAPIVTNTLSTSRSTYLLRFNSANRYVAAAHGDKSVSIYCVVTNRLVARCVGHGRSPWSITFHPTYPYLLASGCLGGSVRLWNLESLTTFGEDSIEPLNITCRRKWKHAGAVASVAFHPVHPILSVSCTQEILFYDWISGNKLSVWRFASDFSRVRWVKFSPAGDLVYTATANPPSSTQASTESAVEKCSSSNGMTVHTSTLYADSPIPRDSLLLFLIRQPDCWFTDLGICDNCSIRLCRWAGALGPKFPAPVVDVHEGLQRATQLATVIAKTMKMAGVDFTRTVQSFITDGTEICDASRRLSSDANPSAVAIIEDMPAKEFLLSRGNYCSSPSVLPKKSVCCGGHAFDLVSTHRDLLKHSICRNCLNAFWHWASCNVNWWCWSGKQESETQESSAQNDRISPTQRDQSDVDDSVNTFSESEEAVGICIQCQACMSCEPNTSDVNESKSNAIHLAGLQLLRSRLSNATDVTPLTYLSSDLIGEGTMTDFFRASLESDPIPVSLPPSIASVLYGSDTVIDSPLSKRRKLLDSQCDLSDSSSTYDSDSSETTIPDVIDWTEEAAALGRRLNNTPLQAWNFPRRVRVEKCHSPCTDDSVMNLFPYVSCGSGLFKPICSIGNAGKTHNNRTIISYRPNASVNQTLTACCRCGHIVPETFPVDPKSVMSTLVSEKFMLPDGQCSSKIKVSLTKTVFTAPLNPIIVPTLSSNESKNPGSDAPRPSNDTMYLINQTGNNTLLNSVNRSVTEVIAGLFGDMGEHCSATALQNSTYRVCCWQLDLSIPSNYSQHLEASSHVHKSLENVPPMPANVTVSYNTNSLVIPHARLFNDSSICISPDGRTIAAFVAVNNHGVDEYIRETPTNISSGHWDTILVVYRLQPKSFRGDCLFSHRFTDSNPVCLDFSPSGNYLVVGMATTRLPSAEQVPLFNPGDLLHIPQLPAISSTTRETNTERRLFSTDLTEEESFVAKIFHLERVLNKEDKSVVDHSLSEVSTISHPNFLNPRSSLVEELYPKKLSDGLDDWHRLLLSRSKRISLNTILWNPKGGLIYGTTKGLIVHMVVQPYGTNAISTIDPLDSEDSNERMNLE